MSKGFGLPLQLEEVANNLRKKQMHDQEGEDEDGQAQLSDLQVLLYSSRRFGPQSIRELTVSAFAAYEAIMNRAAVPGAWRAAFSQCCSIRS